MNAPLRILAPPVLAALAVGAAAGFAANWLERRFAPVGLFPLLIGAAVGLAMFGVGWTLHRVGRVSLALSTTVAVLVCGAAMHYASYLSARRAADVDFENHQRMLQAFPQKGFVTPPPEVGSFGDFLRREWELGRKLGPKTIAGAWLGLWWALDWFALWIGALVAALFCGERPRPTRRSILDDEAAPPETSTMEESP
jgi:hypothetical protein